MRAIWIADDNELECQVIAAVLEYETGTSPVRMSGAGLFRRVKRGLVPDGLVLDTAMVRAASAEVRRSLQLVDRLVVVTSDLAKSAAESDRHPSGARRLVRPLLQRRLARAMLWLDRYTDDDSWSLPLVADAAPDVSRALPAEPALHRAVAADRNEEAEWEATGQWSPECE
jgi:CheY-like chemotaxis protein